MGVTGWLISVAEEGSATDPAISLFAVWEVDESRACSLLERRMHCKGQRLAVIEQLSDEALLAYGTQPKHIASVSGNRPHDLASKF